MRRLLTQTAIPLDSDLGLFVGSAAYEAAGGTVTRDLFSGDDEGFMDDAGQGAACRSAPCPRSSPRQWCPLRHDGACPRAGGGHPGRRQGVETMLALKSVLPSLPVIAGLSANHLAALDLPPAPGSGPGQASLLRLYVARDNDAPGLRAANRLRERGLAAGLEIRELVPVNGDFNLDLCRLGADIMRALVADQLVPSDRTRFLRDTRRSEPRR